MTLAGDSGPRGAAHGAARHAAAAPGAGAGGGSAVTLAAARRAERLVDASTAELGPDELRADDRRIGVVRVAPVARVAWDTGEPVRRRGVRGARSRTGGSPEGTR